MSDQSDNFDNIARRYRQFAATQAQGVSARYEELSRGIADSDSLLAFLATLPTTRQQPNLFLGAVRHVAGLARDIDHFEHLVRDHDTDIRNVMLTRTTQTNEPARCAVLLPALASLRQPLALIEVGASAGLCLFPDYYNYTYDGRKVAATMVDPTAAPEFPCAANPETPIPQAPPQIVWRAGLDLNPLDVNSKAEMDWLQTLVWPEQKARANRLKSAIAIVRQQSPDLHRGNLLDDLPLLVQSAPPDAQLVIFHTAVLAYVSDSAERRRFAELVTNLNAVWLSNEAPSVFPDHAIGAPTPPQPGSFLMAVNGRPVAWTGPHGQYIHWFAEQPTQQA